MNWGLIATGVVVLAGAAAGSLWWARRSLVQVVIDGDSMAPTLADGRAVLVRRCRGGPVAAGEVVAVAPEFAGPDGTGIRPNPSEGRLWIIKRVAAVPGEPIPPGLGVLADRAGEPVPDGYLVLLGDNPDRSHDSRHDGLIALDRLRGKLLGSN